MIGCDDRTPKTMVAMKPLRKRASDIGIPKLICDASPSSLLAGSILAGFQPAGNRDCFLLPAVRDDISADAIDTPKRLPRDDWLIMLPTGDKVIGQAEELN